MKLKDELKHFKTDRASLRSFAWIVGGIFLLIGLFAGLKNGNWTNFFSCLGTGLIAFGLIAPNLLKPVYIGWMALGLLMGLVVAPILFGLLFFVAVTPMALLMRLTGKKFLNLKFRTSEKSYWIQKVKKHDYKKSIENQF